MKPPVVARIEDDVLLDSRRALVHATQRWMAVADIHFGYEVHQAKKGALLPDFGMPQIEQTLKALIADHLPRRLILVGDIMDGSGSAEETLNLLACLQPHVAEIICILGNHDRPALRRSWPFVETHREEGFLFSHGHHFKKVENHATDGDAVHITGHEHPAVSLSDGAGLRLKLPALVRELIAQSRERWILPAFSPWAAGGAYASRTVKEHWICAPGRVWRHAAA
ncbi:MAG: metallophosphoesterase [Prosthecobacter sp.]|jgi:putative SbcD/Mre11-related phosphoesterase|uniref:metallophosphoesterase n=1 Tax=Prosthecobacter sp. TaxID=1965333 RepID=UPI0019DB5AF4|nr:metallophosphoesterase [Prosthecobacter sp.]MBE2284241.1 metallophosphoesterase [Prosthecobacter sp.]